MIKLPPIGEVFHKTFYSNGHTEYKIIEAKNACNTDGTNPKGINEKEFEGCVIQSVFIPNNPKSPKIHRNHWHIRSMTDFINHIKDSYEFCTEDIKEAG